MRVKIAFRYFGVELLTAVLFLCVWRSFPPRVAVAYWVFVSLVVVATFIDFEHFIIPTSITIGGTVAGIAASLAVPQLMAAIRGLPRLSVRCLPQRWDMSFSGLSSKREKSHLGANAFALIRRRLFFGNGKGTIADFGVGEEHSRWSEYFARETDRLILYCNEAAIDHRSLGEVTLEFYYNRVRRAGEQEFVLDTLRSDRRRCQRTSDSARSHR